MKRLQKPGVPESREHLYRMRHVKYRHRGFTREDKDQWKGHIDELYQDIQHSAKERLNDLSKVIDNAEDYHVTAKVLGLPMKPSSPLHELEGSSVDTVLELPMEFVNRLDARSESKSGYFERESKSTISSSQTSDDVQDYPDFRQSHIHNRRFHSSLVQVRQTTSESEDDSDADIAVNPPTPPPEEDLEPWVDKRSPYQKFFCLPEFKAARWRRGFTESKPRELLTVQEREEHLYNSIASDFCKWVRDCQFQKVQLDETTVTELFQVGMETPAVKAMCVETKELPTVPAEVAKIFNMPEKSEMSSIQRQVKWDVKIAQLTEKGIINKPQWKRGNVKSDCSCIATDKIKKPRASEKLEEWLSTNLLDKSEKTGELLWQKLEETKVFKHFCNWMIDNTKFKRPQYLEKKGYFKNRFNIDEGAIVKDIANSRETTLTTREYIQNLVASDARYATILDDLITDIPSLKSFLGTDQRKSKAARDKKSKSDWSSPMKPLTEGVRDDQMHDSTPHHRALINHPEWS